MFECLPLTRVVTACGVFIFKKDVDTCLIPDTDRGMEQSVFVTEPAVVCK